jgi:N-methylhydantoinase A/oxoprolinase/acetone carboxylase beta subunit
VIGSHPRQAQGDQYTPLSVEEVAFGFVQVANEAMCRPIRALTQSKVRRNEKHQINHRLKLVKKPFFE